jgi:hypothetical protein
VATCGHQVGDYISRTPCYGVFSAHTAEICGEPLPPYACRNLMKQSGSLRRRVTENESGLSATAYRWLQPRDVGYSTILQLCIN